MHSRYADCGIYWISGTRATINDWHRHAPMSRNPGALLLLLPTGAVWLIAKLVGIVEGQQLMIVVSLQALLLAVLGRRIYQVLRFPFLYLFFLVPTGDFLVPYLQDFTAWFVVAG